MKRLSSPWLKNLALFALIVCISAPAWPQQLPEAAPEQVGLSKERLALVRTMMEKQIRDGKIVGGVGLIARRGKVAYFETFGDADREAHKPMRKDNIFRIYSMTKAITAVAVMTLHEQGLFSLNDPIGKYLPEFANMKVSIEESDLATGQHVNRVVPAARQITIRDLLRHTSGLSYAGPHDETGAAIYDKLGVNGLARTGMTLEQFSQKLASAPLMREPGTAFEYSMSIDVLGRLVEVISGQPFDQYLSEHIFKPLRMNDTGFYVPQEKWDRLTVIYGLKDGKLTRLADPVAQDGYKTKPDVTLGGSGLASTTLDYARFITMLLNGGQLEGVRILSPKTVELMTADHLGSLPRADRVLQPGLGMGLGAAVNTGPGNTGTLGSVGEYNWGGYAGTIWWVDPKEQLVGVFMIQNFADDFVAATKFKDIVYQSIVEVGK